MRPPAVLACLLLGGAALMPRAAAAEPADAPACQGGVGHADDLTRGCNGAIESHRKRHIARLHA